jgi:hypothetical protein
MKKPNEFIPFEMTFYRCCSWRRVSGLALRLKSHAGLERFLQKTVQVSLDRVEVDTEVR